MEPEVSLPCTQEIVICLSTEPEESGPRPPI